MGTPFVINDSVTVNGFNYSKTATVDADNVVRTKKTMAAAKVGQLTTRTNNTDGTLTMDPGHGIITADRLDLYWTEAGVKGHRRGIVVGTVSGNSVPISGGAGDNLPTNLTAITAQVPTSEAVVITGSNVQYFAFYAQRRGLLVFTDGSNVELGFAKVDEDGYADFWYTGSGITNPLAGDSIAKVWFSTGSSAGTAILQLDAGYN